MSTLPHLVRAPASVPALLAGAAGLGAAFLVGVAVARSPALGLAAAMGILVGTLALIDFPMAVAAFAATLFLRTVPGIGLAGSALGLLVLAGWLAAVAGRAVRVRRALDRGRVAMVGAALLWLWLALSAAWAEQSGAVLDELLYWSQGLLLLLIVATTLDTERRLRVVAWGFVISALGAVAYGALSGDLTANTDAFETSADEGRFAGASDPNELAAGMVAAVAVLFGLLAGMRRGPQRLLAAAAVLPLVAAIAATQSRGGLLAAVCCVMVTIVVARGRRLAALVLTAAILSVGLFALATTPGALDRVTSTDNGGNGRTALWTVAGRMFADHPGVGVGLNNFRTESPAYVRDPGSLDSVRLIVEDPKLVHNTYLQLLAEAGVVGLLIFLALVLACVLATHRAGRRFEAAGAAGLTGLARGVLIGQVGLMAAMMFLSMGDDLRLWLLLGFGPALLALAPARAVAPTSGSVVARGSLDR